MKEIELSTMSYTPATVSGLQEVLREFEVRHEVKVHITMLNWESSWTEVMKYALYGHGPALSEVGDTWIQSLATLNALRAFEKHEVDAMGGPTAFVPSLWQSGVERGTGRIWAIPWLSETRVIFYRRDWLKAAGIDEQTAFLNQAQLENTLERLRENGVRIPLTLPTQLTLNTFHSIASWVWGAGGDFVDAEHEAVIFNETAAREGMLSFYSLQRFLAPEARGLAIVDSEALFLSGEAAVTFSGPWLMSETIYVPTQEVKANTGVAVMPGVPFVGGSHWVAWQNVPPEQSMLAYELLKFLNTKETSLKIGQQIGILPARLDALNSPPYTEDAWLQVMAKGVKAGRAFPAIHLWGMIEDKLSAALGRIWTKVVSGGEVDTDTLIQNELNPLAQRLNWVLASDTSKRK
jgi:multiple sugar transport system substrate-binding protein